MREGDISSSTEQTLASFRQRLAATADVSVIGISTSEGVSPRNAMLERLAWSVSELATPAEQATAIAEILRESNRLPPDQDAHVIATMIHDLVMPGRIVLHDGAQPKVGQCLLQAGLDVAPQLVPQSIAFEVLKLHLHRLAHRQECQFEDDIYDKLDEAGFNQPSLHVASAEAAQQSPFHLAEWLRGQINSQNTGQIQPEAFAALLRDAATLPADLRGGPGGVVTMLASSLSNTVQNPDNAPHNETLLRMIGELPDHLRITALEALYNQLNLVPHETAHLLHGRIRQSAAALQETDALIWFNRSRRDLVAILDEQDKLLTQPDLRAGESLSQYSERTGRDSNSHTAWLFTHMRLRSGR